MQSNALIFSRRPKYRIARHGAFWFFWWLFQGLLYAFPPYGHKMSYLEKLPYTLLNSLLFLPCHIFLAYSLMYFVVPRYLLKNKYLVATAWIIILFLATGTLSSLTALYIVGPVRAWVLPTNLLLSRGPDQESFFMGLMAGLRGSITVGGLAAAIKLMKHWYIKQERNLQLQKENVDAQLQLLRAQVHPHFLFNTLNNIYSYTQNTSETASQLVMGLSDMLRYMLYEGSQSQVPLSREIRMIEEYIGLEQIRYGNRLELHIDLPEDTGGLQIAPLLLLPFVENCFKHGTSDVLDSPWLSLQISVADKMMGMKLLNGKPQRSEKRDQRQTRTDDIRSGATIGGHSPGAGPHRSGIGISNVRKRLELLYPDKHELSIKDDPDVFIVNLKVELKKMFPCPKPPTYELAALLSTMNHPQERS